MSRADKRRRKLKANREAALRPAPGGGGAPTGLPSFAPTPERLARGDIRVEPLVSATDPGRERDWTGDGPRSGPRPVVMGHVRRDLTSSVRRRLERFRDLAPTQIAAAERLERDWELAALEPRMIADLRSAGAGRGWIGGADAAAATLDARERLQAARTALRRGGEEVVRVVEGVVIQEAAADTVGAPAYSARRDASIYARTLLGIGLNLLADWYRAA